MTHPENDEPLPPLDPSETVTIEMPDLCERHEHNFKRHFLSLDCECPQHVELRRRVSLMLKALLVSEVRVTPMVMRRAERDPRNLSLILEELGCLACHAPATYWRAIAILEHGLDAAIRVLVAADENAEGWQLPDLGPRPHA